MAPGTNNNVWQVAQQLQIIIYHLISQTRTGRTQTQVLGVQVYLITILKRQEVQVILLQRLHSMCLIVIMPKGSLLVVHQTVHFPIIGQLESLDRNPNQIWTTDQLFRILL